MAVLQRKNRSDALSWNESTGGPGHAPIWTCKCKIEGEVKGVGTAAHKQDARNIAAEEALKALIDSGWS
ncbi:hypothetical protein BDP27DRAFT_1213241 [Rhodocollybia butyracea]|uniref:DRBM domain-containing protein n=1 Tax=Rhodocollybia butyracea TaxID=206335 RepID=A0A9P5PYZ2_9AGAR|nr:hypothetical protein BDP27DRAFT_1213241 [Rhodocollybia butyracea]